MNEYNKSSHAIYDIKYHIIWITKYRYHVLNGNVAFSVREFIRQGFLARGVNILQGSVGKEHIHTYWYYVHQVLHQVNLCNT